MQEKGWGGEWVTRERPDDGEEAGGSLAKNRRSEDQMSSKSAAAAGGGTGAGRTHVLDPSASTK